LGDKAPPLTAVYSRSEKSAKDLALAAADILKRPLPSIYHEGRTAKNLDALLARSDISAVIVVLPITLQPSIVEKALAAGKHVVSSCLNTECQPS
jgi:predicted dehydrogenase